MKIQVDDNIPIVALIEALNGIGLTLSNVGEWTFRLHFLPGRTPEQVLDLMMKRGMRELFRTLQRGGPQLRVVPTDPPGAA